MLTSKELNAKIGGIKRTTASLRENIHVVLCNVAGHAFEYGDVTAFTKLFEATSGVNRKRITAWVHANGFATLQKDGTFKINKTQRKESDFVDGDAVVEYLTNEVPAWYVNEESAATIIKELDAVQRIKSLTSQITKDDAVIKPVDLAAYRQAMQDLDDAIKSVA